MYNDSAVHVVIDQSLFQAVRNHRVSDLKLEKPALIRVNFMEIIHSSNEIKKTIPPQLTKYWLSGLFTIFLTGILIFIHTRLYHYAFDDAYIHFRIARNFIETGYPYYNAGEAIKVSTSSGWTVFLTIIYGVARSFKVDNSIPLIISIFNALTTMAGLFVYTAIIEKILQAKLRVFPRLLFQFCFLALFLPSSIGLMETPFALLIAGIGILLLLISRPSGFIMLGLAAYLRVELLVLLALAGLFVFFKKQFPFWRISGYSATGFLPLLVYDLYYFHTPIPQSIVAKSIVYTSDGSASAPSTLLYIILILSVGITCISIIFINKRPEYREWKGFKSYWPLLFWLWGLLVVGGYILRQAFIFEWYVPLFSLPCLIAGFLWLFSIEHLKNLVLRSLVGVIFLISVLSIVIDFMASVGHPNLFSLFESGSRVKSYLNTGAILYTEYPDATLLTSEIGGLGYSFRGMILDAAGLTSPAALAYHPMKVPEERATGQIGAIPPGYVEDTLPELIVSYDLFAQALLSSEIINNYHMVQISAFLPEDAAYSKSGTIWGSQYLRVYIRSDLPVSESLIALGNK